LTGSGEMKGEPAWGGPEKEGEIQRDEGVPRDSQIESGIGRNSKDLIITEICEIFKNAHGTLGKKKQNSEVAKMKKAENIRRSKVNVGGEGESVHKK